MLKSLKNEDDVVRWLAESPANFIEFMWELTPQPLKPERELQMKIGRTLKHAEWQSFIETVDNSWFEPFVPGKHITWQQWLICLCWEKAVKGEASRKISIVAGRGIGKCNIIGAITLWFLYCFTLSHVLATAVTAEQLEGALWKEIAMWLSRMPEEYRSMYEYSSNHVRMKESPNAWYAHARTSSKDRPEALSGVHSGYITGIADEASAVHERVFEMAQGILTSGNAFLVMISNGTTNSGFFFNSHNANRAAYQCLSFNSEQSPVVDKAFIASIIDSYCINVPPSQYHTVTEYRVNVLGLFPKEGVMDDKGYVNLLDEKDIIEEDFPDVSFVGHRVMGVDCSGDGDDKSAWCVRDRVRAAIVDEQLLSTPSQIGSRTVTIAEKYDIEEESFRDIVIDAFGVGHPVSQEVAIITKGKGRTYPVNVGDQCELESDRELFMNQRAEGYWKLRTWVKKGGIIARHKGLKTDLLNIKYRRVGNKIQIEPKLEMKKRGIKSPDYSDSMMLTFLRDLQAHQQTKEEISLIKRLEDKFDPHSVFAD